MLLINRFFLSKKAITALLTASFVLVAGLVLMNAYQHYSKALHTLNPVMPPVIPKVDRNYGQLPLSFIQSKPADKVARTDTQFYEYNAGRTTALSQEGITLTLTHQVKNEAWTDPAKNPNTFPHKILWKEEKSLLSR